MLTDEYEYACVAFTNYEYLRFEIEHVTREWCPCVFIDNLINKSTRNISLNCLVSDVFILLHYSSRTRPIIA